MRITYTKNFIRVIGKIWMPQITAAMEYELTMNELNEAGIDWANPTREHVGHWIHLSGNTGDFSVIEDFSADIGENKIVPWAKEESECTYIDCVSEPE